MMAIVIGAPDKKHPKSAPNHARLPKNRLGNIGSTSDAGRLA